MVSLQGLAWMSQVTEQISVGFQGLIGPDGTDRQTNAPFKGALLKLSVRAAKKNARFVWKNSNGSMSRLLIDTGSLRLMLDISMISSNSQSNTLTGFAQGNVSNMPSYAQPAKTHLSKARFQLGQSKRKILPCERQDCPFLSPIQIVLAKAWISYFGKHDSPARHYAKFGLRTIQSAGLIASSQMLGA